jgi:hypothetical protein
MFGNRVLRRIFGRKREELAGCWGRLHNEELHNLYSSQNIINVVNSRKDRREIHKKFWVGEPEGERPRRR